MPKITKRSRAAVTADYDAHSAVERELALRFFVAGSTGRSCIAAGGFGPTEHRVNYLAGNDRLAESFTRSKYWIAASFTREGAVTGLERKLTSPNDCCLRDRTIVSPLSDH
jgi:hypothetical protein